MPLWSFVYMYIYVYIELPFRLEENNDAGVWSVNNDNRTQFDQNKTQGCRDFLTIPKK